jgi:transcriptional regulator GlxA family with amidase domain
MKKKLNVLTMPDRKSKPCMVPLTAANDPRVRTALHLFNLEYRSSRVHMKEIADSVHISRSRLRHLFRAETGISPTRYVKLLRLELARRLMESSFLSVKEVCAAVGASDFSHFVRSYKSVFGETPSQTRAECQSV